jgi:hypothetical protein
VCGTDKARKHSFDSDAGHIEHSSSTSPTEDAHVEAEGSHGKRKKNILRRGRMASRSVGSPEHSHGSHA